MWDTGAGLRVYLAAGSTDMRKQINSLTILVQEALEMDPFTGSLFVFCNRRRSTVKALYWERNGFCLWQKRLEEERFRWPETGEEVLRISPQQLRWLLDGLDLVQQRAHQSLSYASVT